MQFFSTFERSIFSLEMFKEQISENSIYKLVQKIRHIRGREGKRWGMGWEFSL